MRSGPGKLRAGWGPAGRNSTARPGELRAGWGTARRNSTARPGELRAGWGTAGPGELRAGWGTAGRNSPGGAPRGVGHRRAPGSSARGGGGIRRCSPRPTVEIERQSSCSGGLKRGRRLLLVSTMIPSGKEHDFRREIYF